LALHLLLTAGIESADISRGSSSSSSSSKACSIHSSVAGHEGAASAGAAELLQQSLAICRLLPSSTSMAECAAMVPAK
jgi:hypothetical protein